jgi:DNA-binding CsgD family transcriptional regulator
LPYIIYPVSQIFYRSNKSSAAIYLFVGLVTVALDINVMGISGIIYMYFSFNEIKSIKYSLFLMAATIISLSLRLYILKSSGAESIVSMLLFLFIFITFYIKVLKDNTNMSKLPEEIKAILKLYCNGYTYQQISITLGLGITPGTVRRKITSMMGKHNIKNDAQLGKWLHRNV